MKIIARKPVALAGTIDAEYVVIDRGEQEPHRYVSATINRLSTQFNEWYWGHYFKTLGEALHHFNGRCA